MRFTQKLLGNFVRKVLVCCYQKQYENDELKPNFVDYCSDIKERLENLENENVS